MNTLSIAIAVYNEERHLKQCLDSVVDIAGEIVVVDGGSTDKTVDIAKTFHAHLIVTDNPSIFHINKQKALEHCSEEWILQLDADEVVTSALKEEILSVISRKEKNNGFFIPRRNIFWGHPMKKTGVYPDYVIRLVRRGKARFPAKSVHEQIEVDGAVGYFHEPLIHYSYETLHDYWRKANAYTSLTAQELQEKHTEKTVMNFIRYVKIYPLKTFFTLFIRNQGFVDGIYGFLFSFFSALHYPIAYYKYLRM